MTEEQIERTIAKQVCEFHQISTPFEMGKSCIYHKGKYVSGNEALNRINQCISDVADQTTITKGEQEKPYNLSMGKLNIILEFIKAETLCSLKEFDADENVLNLQNGLYYLNGYKVPGTADDNDGYDVIEHNQQVIFYKYKHFKPYSELKEPYKSFIQIPVEYNPEAKCPKIDKIFKDVFGDDWKLLYELIGYLILPTVKYSKAVMFYGPTGTGKTTALNIIYQFIGLENTSGIELQMLDVKFEIEKTRNKLANIFDDLGSRPIKYVGNFKGLVTNKYMKGRIKNIQYEVQWLNKCKCIFSCNELPQIKKYVTDAFYKRWILEPCLNNFKELGIEDENIREHDYSKEEMSGLLNMAIGGIRRLEKRKGFPKKWQDIDFVRDYWNMDINPVSKFITECCDLEKNLEVDYNIFYTELNKFRDKYKVKPISKTHMTRSINKLEKEIEKIQVSKKSPQIEDFPSGYKFTGVGFKTDYILDVIEKKEKKTKLEEFIDDSNISWN